MPTATKAAPAAKPTPSTRPIVKVVCRTSSRADTGFTTDQPLRRTVPAADGLEGYQLVFTPGVPVVLNEREIAACANDLAHGNLTEATISDAHLRALLENFADAARDKQIAELRAEVASLKG